jgi:hypothetical protein
MEETLLSLAKLSPVVAILAWIVWVQGRRVDRYEEAAQARELAQQQACTERESALSHRLTEVENRGHDQLVEMQTAHTEIARLNAETSRTFARALDRWSDRIDSNSGLAPTKRCT